MGSRSLRICYVSHSQAHFTAPFVDYFNGCGHEVHLITCTPADLPGAINHHVVTGEFDVQKAGFRYVWLGRRVRRLLHRIKPDIVHAHYLTSNGLMAAMSGVHPLVVTAHGSDIHHSIQHRLRRSLIRYVMHRADLVHTVSDELRKLATSLGVSSEKIFSQTFGIDTKRFADYPRTNAGCQVRKIRLICTRRLEPVYQCGLMMDACAEVAKRGLEFEVVFAASGSLETELRQRVGRLDLGGRVTFLGGYDFDRLPALLGESDIYVSASKWDGTSLSLLEGMAAGLFPVVSDIPANQAWITGHDDGMLFDPTDPVSLADALERAIRDSQLRRHASSILIQRVQQRGDRASFMEALNDRYVILCEQFAGGASRREQAKGSGE